MINQTATFLSGIDIDSLAALIGIIAGIAAVISLIIMWRHYKEEKVTPIEFPFDSTSVEELPKKLNIMFSELPYIERPKTKTNATNTCLGSLVIGKPYSGKTKEAIELIREIRGDLTILVPKGKGTISPFEVIPNEIKGDVILFLDDLPRYYVKPKEFQDSLEKAIEMLKKTCASVSMVATARSTELDKLYKYSSSSFWNNFENIELEEFERIQTEQLLEVLCGQLNMTIDADAKDLIAAENDRTPKNPVIFFNWLKNNKIEHISAEIAKEFKLSVSDSWNAIYNSLSEIEKEVFQALDVLRYGSVIAHKVFVVDLITKQESTFIPIRKGIEKAIETLIEKHLIEEQENIIRCDDAYLEGKGDFDTNIQTLVDILLKRSKSKEIKDSVLFSLAGLSDVLAEKTEFVEENVEITRKIIESNPDFAIAHNNLGSLLAYRGRKADAEAEYGEALRINPDYADAHNNLGSLLADMGRKEDAEAEYGEALRINPDYAGAHNNLGSLLADMGRKEDAEAEYRESLRINPDYADAHYNLGILLDDMGRKEDAEAEYRESLRINPDYADAHYNLGILLDDMGRKEDAEAEYRESLRINPNDADAHNNLGILLDDVGRKEDAEVEYRESLRINPNDADAHYNLGILLKDMGRKEDAEAEYRESLRINPDYADAHYNLGILLDDMGRKEDAEAEYRESLRINPDSAKAHYNLGNLLNKMGRKGDAEAEYREALRINPNFAEAHANLGILYSETGSNEEAKKELEIAKRLFDEQGREADVKKTEELFKRLSNNSKLGEKERQIML